MKKMYIEDAVNYCLNHKAVIHTPTKDIYNSLMSYLDESILRWSNGYKASGFDCYSTHKEDTCILVTKQGHEIGYSRIGFFIEEGYEIIGLSSVSIDGISYTNKDKAISKIESIFSSFPSAGDIYYWIDSEGKVTFDEWVNDAVDKNHLAIGNCYKTEGEAESVLDRVIKSYKG